MVIHDIFKSCLVEFPANRFYLIDTLNELA
jgi:hypothetical protein